MACAGRCVKANKSCGSPYPKRETSGGNNCRSSIFLENLEISGKLKVSEAHNRNTTNLHRFNKLNNELKTFTNGQNIVVFNQPQFFWHLL